jgi:hypothetical protein
MSRNAHGVLLASLAKELKSGSPGVHLRQGVITAADAGSSTVTVTIDGGAVELSGVKYAAHVPPSVGMTCWLVINGHDMFVLATLTNPLPSPVEASDTAIRSITSGSYANIPTASVAASIVLPVKCLVRVNYGCWWGSGSLGTPSNNGILSVALSGAVTQAARDFGGILGTTPGVAHGGAASFDVEVPAGTLTATLQARYIGSSGISLRNTLVQLSVVRPL